MPSSNCPAILHPLVLLVLLAGSAVAQSTAGRSAAPAEGKAQPVEVAPADLSSLNQLLPVGKTALKVTVPTVDETGRLTSIVVMGSITRIDEDNFQLEKVSISSFEHREESDPAATPDKTVIRLVEGRYHAPTRILVSDRPVTIRKPTLFLTGDSLHYDSGTGRALIKGNTLLLITDVPRLETEEEEVKEEEVSEGEGDEEESSRELKPAAPAAPTTTPNRQ